MSAPATISTQWWTEFRDPYLDSLVAKAISGNFDLKILAARIAVANLQIAEAGAPGLPTVDIGAGASLEKSTGQRSSKQFSLGAQVNWEIDVWGKVSKGVQAQTAEFQATEADWRAGYLTLVSSVSTTYFQILQLDEQIDQQQRALAKNQQILGIFETMRDSGLVPATQVLRQRAEDRPADQGTAGAAALSQRVRERAGHPARRAGRRAQGARGPPPGPGADSRWCPPACLRSCWRAGPTSSRPSSACSRPMT